MTFVFYQESLPAENTKSKTNDYNTYIGGPAANAAITYTKLGGKAAVITAIGDSLIGKTIRESLEADYGIKIFDVMEGSKALPSISGIAINTKSGSRTIWNGRQSANAAFKDTYDDILAQVLFGLFDCNMPYVTKDVMQKLNARNIPIVLDAGSWKPDMPYFLSKADTAIASEVCREPNGTDFITTARKSGVPRRAVTMGEAPLLWETNEGSGKILPPQVKTVDTLAAGDIFHGAYCYFAYMENLPFRDALSKASEVAAASVAYRGPRTGVNRYKNGQGQEGPTD